MTKTLVDITVVDAEKRRVPSKHYVYVIHVQWSDGSSMVIYRRYSRFFDLQTQLLDKFPIQAGAADPSLRIIPFLPGKIFFGRSQIRDVAMKRLGEIDTYCKALLKLPAEISQCDEVLEFFEVEPDDLEPPKSEDKKQSGDKKPSKISGPKQLEQYTAVADYEAQEKGEASLQAGMTVEVVEKSESGWWFVSADDHQGWVPSTYLKTLDNSGANTHANVRVEDGEEERYICIETYSAQNEDELSLSKGVLVEVVQKNMDGWWEVRYQGQVGIAPATYLKKCSDPYARSLVEKSRHSGVQIIGTLADVSNLMTSSSTTPHNAGIFSTPASGAKNTAAKPLEDQAKVSKNPETQEEMDVVGKMQLQKDSHAQRQSQIVIKQRSLERGGNLKPPPRQSSVQSVHLCVPSSPGSKSATYVTAADFEDTVGDGISFSAGEFVTVLEKSSSGWWFVRRGQDEGWVPEAYLMQENAADSQRESMSLHSTYDSFDESSEDEEPCSTTPADGLAGVLKDKLSNKPATAPPKPPSKEIKPPPPAPPVKSADQTAPKSTADSGQHAGIPSSLKSKFEKTVDSQSKVTQKPSLPLQAPKKVQYMAQEDSTLGTGSRTDFPSTRADGSLKSRLEAIQKHMDKPDKPAGKPTLPATKPATPFKGNIGTDQTSGKPNLLQKPPDVTLKASEFSRPLPPFKVKENQGSSSNTGSTVSFSKPQMGPKLPAGPPKLPSKPQASKTSSQSSTSTSVLPPPSHKKVHDMAATFTKLNTTSATADSAGSKPSLPAKKPALQAPRDKPGAKNLDLGAGTPRVGNLVSELSGKLNFGSAGSGPKLTSSETSHRSPESTPVTKVTPWSVTPNGNNNPSAALTSSGAKPGVSSSQTTTLQYKAVADYVASSVGEISLICGEAVEVTDKQEDWCLVRAQAGEGWAPSSYLEKASTLGTGKVPKPKAGSKVIFRTLCAFQAESSSEVSFEEGEEVQVLEESDSGWWKIEVAGREGWAPSDYIAHN
ncbi:SH3 and PX domain-containing protein 2A-like isoform X2 [Pomacea canaliculata]|uniref:SH3 and PX domain-containing protein 2A-like isoform X2 n=1 Tax=Pomacea canaliculata TaxID=400727 RepID=UPI000D730E05|nr:SH3 and PX domain-containing protein 2A-like isoform X2 [Pomacea canaliculata]